MIEFDDLLNELLYGEKNKKAEKPEPKKEPEQRKYEGKSEKDNCCIIVRYKDKHPEKAMVTLGLTDDEGKRQDSLALMYAVCNLLGDTLDIDKGVLAKDMIGAVTMSLLKCAFHAVANGEWEDDED